MALVTGLLIKYYLFLSEIIIQHCVVPSHSPPPECQINNVGELERQHQARTSNLQQPCHAMPSHAYLLTSTKINLMPPEGKVTWDFFFFKLSRGTEASIYLQEKEIVLEGE